MSKISQIPVKYECCMCKEILKVSKDLMKLKKAEPFALL